MSEEAIKAAAAKLMGAIQSNPDAAKLTLTARTALKQGTLCEATVRKHSLVVDEPTDLGGTNMAMNPVELVLAALGTCQEITYSMYAAVSGIPLEGVRLHGHIDVRGLLGMGENVPPGFSRIDVATEVDSPADEAAIRQLAQLVEKHCPVLNMLTGSVDVRGTVSLNGKKLALAESA